LLQAVEAGELGAQIEAAAVKLCEGFVKQNHPRSVTIDMGMNRYLVTLRIDGQLIKSVVSADSAVHARLLCQYQFGKGYEHVAPKQIQKIRLQLQGLALNRLAISCPRSITAMA
jgi:hypothetical protein